MEDFDFPGSLAGTQTKSDYSRVQARMLDQLQFKMQQTINLKDDEIARLRDELAYLQSQLDTNTDKQKHSSIPKNESISELKRRIFKAKQKINMNIAHVKTDHATYLKECIQHHDEELKGLRKKLEYIMFDKIDEKQQTDRVENFVASLQDSKYKARQKAEKERADKQRIVTLFEQIKQYESRAAEAKRQIQTTETNIESTKMKIDQLKSHEDLHDDQNLISRRGGYDSSDRDSVDFTFGLSKHKRSDSSSFDENNSDDDLDYGKNKKRTTSFNPQQKRSDIVSSKKFLQNQLSSDSDSGSEPTSPVPKSHKYSNPIEKSDSSNEGTSSIEDNSLDDNDSIDTKLKGAKKSVRKDIPLIDLQAELEKVKISSKSRIKKLKAEIEKQQKRIVAADSSMASLSEDTTAEQEIADEKWARSTYIDDFVNMTDEQKERLRRTLLKENKTLKREIGRIDFMIYGKNGKYIKWRLIH